MNIGPAITRALEASGLRQVDLARRVDQHPSTVHAWLHGRRQPRLEMLARIARELGTTVDALIAGARPGASRSRKSPL